MLRVMVFFSLYGEPFPANHDLFKLYKSCLDLV